MIYICIPVFNRVDYTKRCLQSIKKQIYTDYAIIICDDGSTDGTSEIIAANFPEVKIIHGSGNLWWSGSTNRCVEYSLEKADTDDYIFTLNNDTELSPDTLQVLIDFSKDNQDSIIACGNFFFNERNRLEATAFIKRTKPPFSLYHRQLFPWGQDIANLNSRIYEVSSVSGKGVLIPVSVFKKIGFYNEDKLPQYHGDTEFARRAFDSGFKIYLNLNAIIYTDQLASGIGQENSLVSLKDFVLSFGSLRSENNFTSLYNRSRLIYKKKWLVYLSANLLSIFFRFIKRCLRRLMKQS
jgi:GT2 family glycosyltransferase